MGQQLSEIRSRGKHERGAILVFVTIALVALVGFAAWSTETGRAWQTKNQLQAAADSAALAGVGSLLAPDFSSVDEAAARTAAVTVGGQNAALGQQLTIGAGDVEVGSWDMTTRTFTPLPGKTDPNIMRSVRAIARRDGTLNGPINTILGKALGVDSIPVNADAVAVWGWAGSGGAGVASLPIAIDCCAVSGPACDQNYCDYVTQNQSNSCPLSSGEMVTCLEFFATPEQNACWTEFGTSSPAVSVPGMTDVVQNGNPDDIGHEPIYLDNGTKTPVVQDIKDKMDAEGSDTNGDGVVDSWIVTLPIVECQNPGDQCASGDTQYIVGFLCMDIREIIVTPDKVIKGDFICSSDPRCDTPGFGPGGTLIGSISADYPVIVE